MQRSVRICMRRLRKGIFQRDPSKWTWIAALYACMHRPEMEPHGKLQKKVADAQPSNWSPTQKGLKTRQKRNTIKKFQDTRLGSWQWQEFFPKNLQDAWLIHRLIIEQPFDIFFLVESQLKQGTVPKLLVQSSTYCRIACCCNKEYFSAINKQPSLQLVDNCTCTWCSNQEKPTNLNGGEYEAIPYDLLKMTNHVHCKMTSQWVLNLKLLQNTW